MVNRTTPVPVARTSGNGEKPEPKRRRRLGEVLVDQGAITPEDLERALNAQRDVKPGERRRRLGSLVVDLGMATERQVASALGAALGLDVVDLAPMSVQHEVSRVMPRSVVERHLMLPIARDGEGRVVVACVDPTNVVALDDVKLYTRSTDIVLVVATESQIRDFMARVWSLSEDSAADVATMLEELDEADEEPDASSFTADAPTVKLVNALLADAVRARASDVHVEPQARELRIRYRVDGLLRDVMNVPKSAAPGLVSRIKVMSNLDIAEHRLPQDGRTRMQIDGVLVDARVSTLPGIHGEKVVVRLLSRAESVPPLTRLGMDDGQLETLLGALIAPQGLVLITGPTGSGKTNTLYSAISQIKTADRNIVTLEDPVEIQLAGITQVQVHERAGLTFAKGLRSVLRQDPDIVLVGEVRDTETAKLALEASLTGHLVLTTLHTNSAPAALTRLVDMGVEPFLIASSLSLVVAQRLIRRVCESCASPYAPPPRVTAVLGLSDEDLVGATPRRGRGCADCGGTGYRGRTGVFEVLPITAAMRSVLVRTPTESAVAAAARAAGMFTLRGAALGKARVGITTYEEVLRATQSDTTSGLQCHSCGHGLADDMVVCPWCTTPVDRGHCAECTRPLEAEWKVCPWCRTPAPDRPEPRPQVPTTATPRLLLVEDDPSVRAYVTTTLTGTVEVDAVETAQEALARVAEQQYDGALIDNLLPDLTGIELIRLLRAESGTTLLPLMLFTGADSHGVESAARHAGADDYLAKPVEPLLLEERVLALVSRSARLYVG